MRDMVGGAGTVHVQGKTVGQALDNLDNQFPGARARVIDQRGKIGNFILIALNDEDIRSLEGLETPLKDGDVLNIITFFSGG